MAAADYRLLTEATGQRIAAALEALSGTGAAAAAARANLDVYSTGEVDTAIAQSTAKPGLYINSTTWADIYAALSSISTNYSASIMVSAAAMSTLTGGIYTSSYACVGIVGRSSDNYFFHVSTSTGNNIYAWRVNGLSSASSTPTIGTLYKYQGSAVS